MLSLVTVTWNSATYLAEFLASVDEFLSRQCEVIVVDNGSDDDTLSVARGARIEVTILALGRNTGFGSANNVGVRATRGTVTALVNPDVRFVDDSLLDLARLAESTGALCGPEVLNVDGTRQPSASPLPGGWEVGLDALVPAAVMPKRLRERCEPWRSTRSVRVGWLTGACVVARKEILEALGPFDDRLHLFAEDMDLGIRAGRAGVLSIYAPTTARLVHVGDHAARKAFDDRGRRQSVANRYAVITWRCGRLRAVYDRFAQALFFSRRSSRLLGEYSVRPCCSRTSLTSR